MAVGKDKKVQIQNHSSFYWPGKLALTQNLTVFSDAGKALN